MRRLKLICLAIITALSLQLVALPAQAKNPPFKLIKQKDRSGKRLAKAAFGRGGNLGAFYDVDADGHLEFIWVRRANDRLSLNLLELDSDREVLNVDIGEGAAAGLVAINLDDDPALEFIVGYGSRVQGLIKKVIVITAAVVMAVSAVNSAASDAGNFDSSISTDVALKSSAAAALFVMASPAAATDLWHLAAFDDDGKKLWQRELDRTPEAAESWRNARFKFVIPNTSGKGATILLTDDSTPALRGLSAHTGETLWSHTVAAGAKPSKRNLSPLVRDGRLLPVLYSSESTLILEPSTGEAILDAQLDARIGRMPTQRVFATRSGPGFLAFGEERNEIRMLSLTTGKTIWTHAMEKIRDVVPAREAGQFIVIWKHGIKFMTTDGEIVSDHAAPSKIKTASSPIYRDLDGDGTPELIYVSGKSIACWEPKSDKLLWTKGLGSMLGAVSPIGLHDAFYDLDGDGWLDIPGNRSSGAGVWLSGKDGEVLTTAGLGTVPPVSGDWNGDGKAEVFWANGWLELVPRR